MALYNYENLLNDSSYLPGKGSCVGFASGGGLRIPRRALHDPPVKEKSSIAMSPL